MNVNAASAISAYKQTVIQKGSFSLSGSYLEITGSAASVAAKDDMNISDMAKDLLERAKSLDIFKVIYPKGDVSKEYKSLDEVEGDFNQDFMDFTGSFGSLFSSMDFGATGLVMGLDGEGGVTVEGEGAAQQKAQSAFNGSSTLVARFAVMAARAALVDARSTVGGFESSYANDPVGAITSNIDALKERLLGFRSVADSNGMSYGFMREFSASIEYSSVATSWGTTLAAETDVA